MFAFAFANLCSHLYVLLCGCGYVLGEDDKIEKLHEGYLIASAEALTLCLQPVAR